MAKFRSSAFYYSITVVAASKDNDDWHAHVRLRKSEETFPLWLCFVLLFRLSLKTFRNKVFVAHNLRFAKHD